MKRVTTQRLSELQKSPENIRNICILAHVDHGKTTLADGLVASNGIISHRMAGKLRYMDSREDEQLRGITMKSSAISLLYQPEDTEYLINLIDSPGHIDFSSEVSTAVRLCDGAIVVVDVVEGVCPQTHAVLRQAWLEHIKPVLVLNKIDRLITELKISPLEAHMHLLKILEQVNAITGELFTTDQFEKSASKITKESDDTKTTGEQAWSDWNVGLDETDDSDLYFSPDQGNVIFASAIDSWGFGINHFAKLYGTKLGIKEDILRKTLWGDFYLNIKTKRIMKGAMAKGKKPLFVQFVLENLWAVYESVLIHDDKEKVAKIINSLNLKIPPRDLRHNDQKVILQAIVRQWLPLSDAILGMVVAKLPSPLEIVEERVVNLLCNRGQSFESLPPETRKLKDDFLACSPGDAPVIVFVSKMVAVDQHSLPQNKQRILTTEDLALRRERARQKHAEMIAKKNSPNMEEKQDESQSNGLKVGHHYLSTGETSTEVAPPDVSTKDDHVFVAFARVFSGTVRKGQKLYVLGPKHDPGKALEEYTGDDMIDPTLTLNNLTSGKHITMFTVDELYLFMGRELESLDEVPAGNTLGISGLSEHVLKSATLSSTISCPPFTAMYFEAAPIVKVAVEPSHPSDMSKLIHGMRLLNQADPCVEVSLEDTGEHVIVAAGEVHLQKCIDDLQERYAKVPVNVSEAIVPFRETVIAPPTVDMVNEAIIAHNKPVLSDPMIDEDDDTILERGLLELKTSNKLCTMRIRCLPLPSKVTELLERSGTLLKTLGHFFRQTEKQQTVHTLSVNEEIRKSIRELKDKLTEEFENAGLPWTNACEEICCFGPKRCGPNILVNRVPGYTRQSIWDCVLGSEKSDFRREYDGCVISGFQMATLAGPLCEEPMVGVCYILEDWTVDSQNGVSDMTEKLSDVQLSEDPGEDSPESEIDKEEQKSSRSKKVYGPFSGQIMSTMKDGCRKAFQTQHQRLMVAMYECVIQVSADVLGKMYGVIGKRNGRIRNEDMKEGSQIFNIDAVMPVVESFGFAEEIRKKTSGLASPQLHFSHWEVVDTDPHWVPTTEEEYLHFGAKADSENRARNYMNLVRKRKGLKVDEQIVVHAEKQRTLTKNK